MVRRATGANCHCTRAADHTGLTTAMAMAVTGKAASVVAAQQVAQQVMALATPPARCFAVPKQAKTQRSLEEHKMAMPFARNSQSRPRPV